MQPFNGIGSYLLRYSETTPGDYTLSIRGQEKVNHYELKQLDGSGYYINELITFTSIQELVLYYQKQANGLCCILQSPCLITEKPQTAGLSKQANEKWEIDRQQIRFVRRVGVGQFGEVWEGMWNGDYPSSRQDVQTWHHITT